MSDAAVIASAPVEMQPRLRKLAADACMREYEATEDLNAYLDSEDFYYGDDA